MQNIHAPPNRFAEMYAIVDIETSGTSYFRGRITEIAIYRHDGEKIIDHFSTLLNPEGPIPREITRLTGITNEMVKEAPRFFEIARQIVEITQDCTFVAHNVHFDYGFIKHEFEMLGFAYTRPTLCTVKQSRKLIPGLKSYSLGNLCQNLQITNQARHRADGDARATVTLLEHLLSIKPELSNQTTRDQLSLYLHPQLKPEILYQLPESQGVYFLHNPDGDVIYCGKSNHIKQRIFQHLRAPKTTKAMRMQQQTASVSYTLTGSELMALLLESEEIKRLQPIFNRAQKRAHFQYGICREEDIFGYSLLKIKKLSANADALATYTQKADAENQLLRIIADHQLCTGLCGLEKCGNGCMQYGLKLCRGAGLYHEGPDSYNQRLEMGIACLSPLRGNFLILDNGRSPDENSAIRISEGKLLSRGYLPKDSNENIFVMLDLLHPMKDNPEVRAITRTYLARRKALKIINLEKVTQ
jgi:DNA polymerase-3 subunit epsilon